MFALTVLPTCLCPPTVKCKAAAAVVIADLKKAGADGKEALTACKTSATQMVEDA